MLGHILGHFCSPFGDFFSNNIWSPCIAANESREKFEAVNESHRQPTVSRKRVRTKK
jgi:hypothetical protein